MKLRLLYFGIVRERLGRREQTRDVAAGTTVGALLAALAASDDIFALGAGSLRVAVNREYVGDDHVLADGDEVAVIPPVAGGSVSLRPDLRPPQPPGKGAGRTEQKGRRRRCSKSPTA